MARWAAKRDNTEAQIIEALRWIGADWEQCTKFDLLVWHKGRVYMVEVKSKGGRLTEGQKDLKRRGWPLHVVRTQEEVLTVLGEVGVVEQLRASGKV